MSARITEAELYRMTVGVIWPPHVVNDATLLIGEVRRLRGIIAHYVEGLDRPDVSPVEMVGRGQAVIAEGRAIREEKP